MASEGSVAGSITAPKGKKHLSWETIAFAVLGGVAAISTGILVLNRKHINIGKHVEENVLDFLKRHGSVISGNKISGGTVMQPMDTDEAVIGTVTYMLTNIEKHASGRDRRKEAGEEETPDDMPPLEEVPSADEVVVVDPPRPHKKSSKKKAAAAAEQPVAASPRSSGGRGTSVQAAHAQTLADDDSDPSAGNKKVAPPFPEPAISGRTGVPVTQSTVGSENGAVPQGPPGGGEEEIEDYVAPMPASMQHPQGDMPPMSDDE